MPLDRFQREIDYLRISLTDHCNLRCVYCMPLQGAAYAPLEGLLTAGEIERVARAAASVGFRKIRLTGGEPTLRPDLVDIVRRIARTDGIRDVVRHAVLGAGRVEGQLIQEDRLFANLLSSQPLCFNLFGELARDLELLAVV